MGGGCANESGSHNGNFISHDVLFPSSNPFNNDLTKLSFRRNHYPTTPYQGHGIVISALCLFRLSHFIEKILNLHKRYDARIIVRLVIYLPDGLPLFALTNDIGSDKVA